MAYVSSTPPIIYRALRRLGIKIRRPGVPLPPRRIREALEQLGSPRVPAMMVHSSLSACGYIEGGAATVVDCLKQWIGTATLVMPTHTYCYPEAGQPTPAFTAEETPSAVGAITNYFRQQPGAIRSIHPSHSVSCQGTLGNELARDHQWCETPCGAGTPYDRLIGLECAVLMFGATMNGYTFFHTAEDAAKCPYLYRPQRIDLTYTDDNGLLWSFKSWRHDMSVKRRFESMDAWLEERGLLRRCALGHGELLYIPNALRAHEALVEAMRADPWLLVDESERSRRVA